MHSRYIVLHWALTCKHDLSVSCNRHGQIIEAATWIALFITNSLANILNLQLIVVALHQMELVNLLDQITLNIIDTK